MSSRPAWARQKASISGTSRADSFLPSTEEKLLAASASSAPRTSGSGSPAGVSGVAASASIAARQDSRGR
ncbi:hypothetical protein [Streptomyces carminius]|uniref:hypothetical protein n=1 Tax=Streptomyces carminius TaxID=2665496 RepID=UPI0038CD8823